MNWGAGQRCGSDPTAGVAPIGPLAWEPPYASEAALKRKKKKYTHTTFFPSNSGKEK